MPNALDIKRLALTRSTVLVALAASAALSLSACVAPGGYGSYGAPPQPAYSQPTYAQPAYSQPVYPQPAESQPVYPQAQPYAQPGYGVQYGTVTNIRPIGGATSPSGVLGTVVGAVAGGVLGNQIGGGRGRDAATVIGAIGGAVAGNQIGQRMGSGSARYRVDVQLQDGSMRSFDMTTPGDLRPGERVQINGNQLSRY